MEYGPGAVSGSKVFLGGSLPMPEDVETKEIRRYVAKHCLSGCHEVLAADIEVSLCTILHYIKHIKQFYSGRGVRELTVFPGYRPYDGDEYDGGPVLPRTPVLKRPAVSLPSRWYTRVLKKTARGQNKIRKYCPPTTDASLSCH